MGELRYPPRAVEHYAVGLVHSLDDAIVRHRSFKVVIDAGSGTASLVLPHLLSRLSLDSLIVNGHLDENRVAPTDSERQGRIIAQQIEQAMNEKLSKELRNGGLLNPNGY